MNTLLTHVKLDYEMMLTVFIDRGKVMARSVNRKTETNYI